MWLLVCLILFFGTFFLSYLLTIFSRKLALKYNIIDYPDIRKIHQSAQPYLGGLAIYSTMTITIIGGIFISFYFLPFITQLPHEITIYLPNIREVLLELSALLLGGTLIFLLGLWDDIKKISPILKLIGQIIISIIVVLMGIRLDLFIPNTFLAALVTVFWIVAITNAFNLLDNMDGLSSGVASIATLLFIIYSYQAGHIYMMVILTVFLGSLLGFLPHNFYPSKIFMGDAGSMFIGFQLGVLTVLNTYYTESPTFLGILLPFFVLSVPLFDTLSVILIRIKNGKPIYQGDKNHFSHRLVSLGMSQSQAVLCIYLVTLCTGMGALLLRSLNFKEALLVLFQMIFIFSIIILLESAGKWKNNK